MGVKFIFCHNLPSLKSNPEPEKRPAPSSESDYADSKEGQDVFLNDLLDKFGGKIHTDDE